MNANILLGLRKSVLFALCGIGLLGSAGLAHAQGWVALASPTTELMLGMDCGSSSYCVAVGMNGTVIRTTDHKTWTAGTSGTTSMIIGVDMYSSTTGIAVGDAGLILKTIDGGATWTSIPGVTGETLYSVSMVSTSIAYIAGQNGAVFKTIDGGATWAGIASSISSIDAYAIDAYSSSIVYVAGANGAAYRTTDSGTTWTALTTGTTETIHAVDAVSSTIAYIGGANALVAKTTNGASFSTQAFSGFGSGEPVIDLTCSTTLLCLVSGGNGVVNITADGGTTWTQETLPSIGTLGGAANYAIARRFVVGDNGILFALDANEPNAVGSLALSTGGTSTTDTTPEFTWTDATDDESSVASYAIAMDGSSTYTNVGDVNSYIATSALAVGSHTIVVIAVDAAGNEGTVSELAFTVTATSSDTTAPVVGAITPTTATAGTSVSLSVSVTEAVAVSSCTLYVDGVSQGAMTVASDKATYAYTPSAAGTLSVYATCTDSSSNIGTGPVTAVTVSAASSDTRAPAVGTVTPTSATQNSATTFSVTATDASGIFACYLMVDGNDQGIMTASSSTYSRSYTPASSGSVSVYAWCGDMAGNTASGTAVTVAVAAATTTTSDTVAPTVGAITPIVATEDVTVTLFASVADSGGMGTCTLYVNGANIGAMTISGAYASRAYTFATAGNSVANAYCVDAAGNATRGASSAVVVSASVSTEEKTAVSEADVNTLIKLACGVSAGVEDPCHAVYYYDGKRHAFPNEKVYFTWYASFDDVIVVTAEFLSSVTLGRNVTYHPGTTMVKFVSVNTVYAVGESGELRAVASEDVAASIWGSNWNTQIDDISDAFYGNYHFGDEINSTSDFDPDAVEASVTDIVDILQQ